MISRLLLSVVLLFLMGLFVWALLKNR